MSKASKAALGLDFGTESVRALIVDLKGNELASSIAKYKHGQITKCLPGTTKPLPPDYAFQHPEDWLTSASRATRKAVKEANLKPKDIIGIGVDFTSCTMLPALNDGTPLCMLKQYSKRPMAWPKLWKHHGAKAQTDRINQVANRRKEPLLKRYGGIIGLEWFFPKALETLEEDPEVYKRTEVFLEAGDWFVWQLIGAETSTLVRSTCQAGYKGMWSAEDGFPSKSFLKAIHPAFKDIVETKMPGTLKAPGEPAGQLSNAFAKKMGLTPGIPISTSIIDAHAGVPGAGAAEPGTLVMVLGTSSCHMLNATENNFVPGVAGIVKGGILPGYYGYETGQAAVGDAFDWLRQTVGHKNFDELSSQAADIPPGAEGVLCMDWMNGCRTPLMDGHLCGAFTGLTLNHTPAHLYRALLEASAFGIQWIVELLQSHDVPVKKFIATGGLPHHNPLVVQVYADVLGKPIQVHPCQYGPALGAAILGAIAAGKSITGFNSTAQAIRAMAAPVKGNAKRKPITYRPNRKNYKFYQNLYTQYRELAEQIQRQTSA